MLLTDYFISLVMIVYVTYNNINKIILFVLISDFIF